MFWAKIHTAPKLLLLSSYISSLRHNNMDILASEPNPQRFFLL